VAFAGVYSWVRFREEAPRRNTEPAWRRLRGFTSDIEKLRLASVEVSDLLDDLPPTTVYRLKDEASLLEKIERKNARRAEELGVSVEELARRGQSYTVRDIGDAIGIRYVTSPWELPVVVDRARRILGPRVAGVEYKRGRYKTVHIDADLWGVGAKRDLNLMAEIQVRTFLQHAYAAGAHDVIYKDVPGHGPWVLRAVKKTAATRWLLPVFDAVMAAPAAVEMALFRRWMRWPRGEQGATGAGRSPGGG
jgi:ppGpp synthetase/RelA/SpoT-type nucleotidyltranferase